MPFSPASFAHAAAACLLLAASARATPVNKAAFERHFDRLLPDKLHACTTCHVPTDAKDPQSLDDIPHNAFGQALVDAGKQLKSRGQKRDIPARLALLAQQDSDGDGVDNLTELLLAHNPGDPKDLPSATELTEAPARRDLYAAYLKTYRFQPFDPVARPPVPAPFGGALNSIDAFVDEQRRAHDVTPAPEAQKLVLLRRVYIDLIGLNPTPEEIAAFEADASPDAYERVVDRLLADPRYGQRWARHWMDVWRYSDWAGYATQVRDSQPFIWRWRDWIVESLNADAPYDRMVTDMLAADELSPTDESALRATGFLVRNFKLLSREQWLEDVVNHTSRAFLGLTVHCAKCHDHKFDPVTQVEYYRLRAIFEPYAVRTDRIPGVADKTKDGLVRAYDQNPQSKTLLFIRGDERTPDTQRGEITPGVPAFLGGSFTVQPVALPRTAAHPDRRAFVRFDLLADATRVLDTARGQWASVQKNDKVADRQRSEIEANFNVLKARHDSLSALLKAEQLEDAGQKDSPEWTAAATAAQSTQRHLAVAEATYALIAAQNAADDALARVNAANAAANEAMAALTAATTTTRPSTTQATAAKAAAEKALADAKAKSAKGLTDMQAAQAKIPPAQKSLAAAVGALSAPPTTAYTPRKTDDYPDVSSGRRAALARWITDPANPLTARVAVNHLWARHFGTGLVPSVDDFGRNGRSATHPALLDYLAAEFAANGWHMKPIHRLIVTSHAYRQSSLPNQKNLAADPDNTWLWRFPSRRLEAELVRDNVLAAAGRLDPTLGGTEIDHAQGLKSRRRSLYLQEAPEKEVEFLKVFDGPNPDECYLRRPSVMPQQALALANSELVIDQARTLARQLAERFADEDSFINGAFLRVLARPATREEIAACRAYFEDIQTPAERARENLLLVLFNHNDFVTVR